MRIALAILGILTLGAYWLAWNNRNSDKVISAIVPIGFAAIFGVITSVLVFGGEPSARTVFPVAFFVDADRHLPVKFEQTRRSKWLGEKIAELADGQPSKEDPERVLFYHHLVQRLLLEHLANRYGEEWDFVTVSYDLPFGQLAFAQKTDQSKGQVLKQKDTNSAGGLKQSDGQSNGVVLKQQDLQTALYGNVLNQIPFNDKVKLVLPPGTTLSGTAPGVERGSEGSIVIQNRYCTITIRTSTLPAYDRIGEYENLPEADSARAAHVPVYDVEIEISYSRLYSGHPDMKSRKAWAGRVTSGLVDEFDEQQMWTRIKAQSDLRSRRALLEVAARTNSESKK